MFDAMLDSRIARFIDDVKAFDAENIPEQDSFESKFSSQVLTFHHLHGCIWTSWTPVWHRGLGEHRALDPCLGWHPYPYFHVETVTRDNDFGVTTSSWRLETWGHLNYESMKNKSQAVLSSAIYFAWLYLSMYLESWQLLSSGHLISSDHFWSLYLLLSFNVVGSWWITFTWLHLIRLIIIHHLSSFHWGCKPHRLGLVPRSGTAGSMMHEKENETNTSFQVFKVGFNFFCHRVFEYDKIWKFSARRLMKPHV